jgi:HEAT repeat protein
VSKQSFDKKLEAIEALRADPGSPDTLNQVRKALRDRNNYFVSKAAALAGDLRLEVVPELLAAFYRFLEEPVKSDPQCWAKTAIAKALKDLGHREPEVFLKGLVHVQLEPVWGGRADSAGTLRGTCALALVDCQLDDLETLTHLADGLADPEKPVRLDVATAISQLGRPEGALLLRLKALLGDPEPEVLGQCFLALESLTPQEAIPFLARFLNLADEQVQIEAAAALAQSREPAAIGLLRTFWTGRVSQELRRALLVALGASTVPEASEFLLSILEQESGELARGALKVLASSRFRGDARERVATLIETKDDAELRRLFDENF